MLVDHAQVHELVRLHLELKSARLTSSPVSWRTSFRSASVRLPCAPALGRGQRGGELFGAVWQRHQARGAFCGGL